MRSYMKSLSLVVQEQRVSAYADYISIFVLYRSDIEVAQKALEWYEKVTVAKINRNKSSSFRLGAWLN